MRKQKLMGKKTFSPFYIILLIILALYVISLFVPIFWALMTSLKTYDEVLYEPLAFPKEWAFSNYVEAFEHLYVPVMNAQGNRNVYLLEMFLYGLLYAGGCAFCATSMTCVASYLTARFQYKFSKIVYAVIIVTMILPIVGALPSEIELSHLIGTYDSMIGLWIQKATFLGMYFLVFHAIFKSVPKDYEEAASLDGAGNLMIFLRIMLPLVSKTFLVVFLLKFIEFWNDYQVPMLFLPSSPTVAYGMFYFNFAPRSSTSGMHMKMAGGFLLVIPILILFLIFRNKLIGNIAIGGLKG